MRLASELVVRDERYAGKGGLALVWRHPKNMLVLDQVQLAVLQAIRDGAQPADYVTRTLARLGHHVGGDHAHRIAEDLVRDFIAYGLVEDGEPCSVDCSWVDPMDASLFPITPLAFPMKVLCVTTFRCNLRCRHCGIACSPDTAYAAELTNAEWLRLFREFHVRGVWEAVLTGGEIMTRRDWRELLEATLDFRFATGIVTNGTLATPEVIEFLCEYAEAKREGFTVAVSLDGASSQTHGWMRGSEELFHRTTHFIRSLTERGLDVNVGMTLHPHNCHEIRAMAELARTLGVREVEFHPTEQYGRALLGSFEMPRTDVLRQVEEVAELQAQFRGSIRLKYEAKRVPLSREMLKSKGFYFEYPFFTAFGYPEHCSDEGIVKCAIDADGTVYPNEKALGQEQFRMGSIRQSSLDEVWKGSQWTFFRGGWSPDELHVCRTCQLKDDCSTLPSRTIPLMALQDPLGPMPECGQLPWLSKEERDGIRERLSRTLGSTS